MTATIALIVAEVMECIIVIAYMTEQTDQKVISRSGGSSGGSGGKVLLFYIFALIVGYGINELLGTILLIGMIFWLIACK